MFAAESLGPRECKGWKQWAKARLPRSGLQFVDEGPVLFAFLGGLAQTTFDDIYVDGDLAGEGWGP